MEILLQASYHRALVSKTGQIRVGRFKNPLFLFFCFIDVVSCYRSYEFIESGVFQKVIQSEERWLIFQYCRVSRGA